jgi:hypothetical protein
MHPKRSGFFSYWGEDRVLDLSGFLCSKCFPNKFSKDSQHSLCVSQDVHNSITLLSHMLCCMRRHYIFLSSYFYYLICFAARGRGTLNFYLKYLYRESKKNYFGETPKFHGCLLSK